jgi:predicted RNA-binding Zn ribbon-like protein
VPTRDTIKTVKPVAQRRQPAFALWWCRTPRELIAIATTRPDPSAKTPAYADLLCDFANTLDVDVDALCADSLVDPAGLTDWLRAHDLLGSDQQADADDLAIARTFRSGLRTAMLRHTEGDHTSTVTDLDDAAGRLPLRVVFDGARPRLAPTDGGARGGVARLLVAVAEAESDDAWRRLKICVADDCQWAFYDTSKNRSRHWCSMGVCGNRQKTRTYRSRQRADRG